MKKRITVFALAILMLLSAFPVAAAAAPAADIEFLTEAIYDGIGAPSDGMIRVRWWGDNYIFLDTNGNVVIDDPLARMREILGDEPLQKRDYSGFYVDDFHDGLALVYYWKRNSRGRSIVHHAYFLEKDGNVAFELRDVSYTSIGPYSDGCILAQSSTDAYTDTFIDIYDKQGNKRTVEIDFRKINDWNGSFASTSFTDGLLRFHVGLEGIDTYGFFDMDFNIAIPPDFRKTSSFKNGMAAVSNGVTWGVIDKTGAFILEPIYDDIEAILDGGIIVVKIDSKYTCVDLEGNQITPLGVSPSIRFTEGLAPEQKKRDWDAGSTIEYIPARYLNMFGEVAFTTDYDAQYNFTNGVALVGKDGEYSFIDTKGDVVSEKTWRFAEVYMGLAHSKYGIFSYQLDNGKCGLARIISPFSASVASPTSSAVLVNGESVSFDAYNINDNNYFKLRDLAYILSGTECQFEVEWNNARNTIVLTSGLPYTEVGGEMQGKGTGDKKPTRTTSGVTLDGKAVIFNAYNIDGNNYFKLRDIGEAFDFEVDWDSANNAIVIDTTTGYTPD